MGLNIRELEVFKPYANELPEALLEEVELNDGEVAAWLGAQTLRIAKKGSDVLGVYAMDRVDAVNFHLHGVIVTQRLRKQGLGRWLVGHAIGVAESKGGRHLHTHATGGSRMYSRLGFARRGDGHVFDMIQE